jgi:hypothetical protein
MLLNSNENLLFNANLGKLFVKISFESAEIFLDYHEGLIEIFLVVYS